MELSIITDDQIIEINRKLDALLAAKGVSQIPGHVFTNKDVAKKLGISLRSLQSYRDKGMIRFSQLGRKIYYSTDDIELFLDQHRVGGLLINRN